MVKTIYLVRHGETDSKKQGKFQAHDTPINTNGINQANKCSVFFKNKNIDIIQSSPINRATQTADILSKKLSIDYSINYDLQEIKNPKEIQGKKYGDTDADSKYRSWLSKLDRLESLGNQDEENYFDLFSRTTYILKDWERSEHDNILAVSHSVTIRSILSFILCNGVMSSQYIDIIQKIKVNNCNEVAIQYSTSGWRIVI